MNNFKKVCPSGNEMVGNEEEQIILNTKQEVQDFINEGLNYFNIEDIIRLWLAFDKDGQISM